MRRKTKEEVLVEFKTTHGDRYDYSLVEFVNMSTKVCIVCKDHGKFYQKPAKHKAGQGCKQCSVITVHETQQKPLHKLIDKFQSIHGTRFDYSKIEYKNAHTPVCIICPDHGEFFQAPHSHKKGSGCPSCHSRDRGKKHALTTGEIKARLDRLYDQRVSLVSKNYVNTNSSLKFSCNIHGEFISTLGSVLTSRHGCPACGNIIGGTKSRLTQAEVIERFIEVHGDRYDYSNVEYNLSSERVNIICEKHGEFKQLVFDHLRGNGCPACAKKESQPERDLAEFCRQMGFTTKTRVRDLIPPKEIDIYLPELNLAIEYNGLIWHSELYKSTDGKVNQARRHMLEKQRACNALGIRLIHINSNEDLTTVKRTLSVITGFDSEKIFARKCKVEKLTDYKQIDNFLNKYHIQGTIPVKAYSYGLTYNNQLVAVMGFSKPTSRRGKHPEGFYELRRYSSICRVTGGASRLLKAFLRDHPESKEIISYSDSRWFTGNMYEQLGFTKEETLAPNYAYVNGHTKYPKNHFTRKRMEERDGFIFDPSISERENCINNNFWRVWDCGKIRWTLKTLT